MNKAGDSNQYTDGQWWRINLLTDGTDPTS